ncbi:MAG: glycerophosphodiester phosphodiesterase [Thermosipho sp. (in: Bacteria)]|nr:glycerophosphodiester phosphodiesterase [Thermosipho sp. (in: thermotogales)]
MYILGHRGYPKMYKENTLESFKAAIEFGADGIELDVWKTKDGEIVVSHDENLERVFGVNLNIKETELEEIKKKAPVPTLREVFNVIPEGKIINVEIKDPDAGDDVVELVRTNNLSEYVIFSSFDHDLIKNLSEKYKGERFGYLFDYRHEKLTFDDLKSLFEPENIYSAHIPIKLLDYNRDLFFSMIELMRNLNKKIVLWTVNEPDIVKKIQPDYVITDEVKKMVEKLK